MRVLLVEDNPVNQRLTGTMLERIGAQVDVVACGSEAVNLLREKPYDMVFMDYWMPGMDGIKCTKEIRKFNRNVPVVALTMSSSGDVREKCLKAGMDDFITKPVEPSSLESLLHKWIAVGEKRK